MEFLVECATSIAAKIVKYVTVVSARRLFDYGPNVDNLRARTQELNDAKETIRGRVEEATRTGEEIHVEVQSWLSRTRSISQRAEGFLNNNRDRANFSCCNVRIPNLASRRQLSREARQMVVDIKRQIEAAEFDSISSRPALHSCIAFRGDYENFESRKTMLEEIMKALQDREVTKIGVYGMGGVGKTMLAKEVARRATDAKLFAEVAMMTISQTPDPRRLQQEIAEKIHLDIKELESVPARADRLQRRLREEKSILIILDDIWERLNLLEVGIHLEHRGCKVLMTSRSLDVVHSMGVEKTFQVYSVFGKEAMNLFQRIVGDIVERPDFKRLAIDVVGECGGLPLAITTVASTLKGQDSLYVWRDTLRRLRNIISLTNIDEPLREVYRSIRLSYDFLSNEQKSLLLLCSLHGEDSNILIEDLIMIGVGCGLFQNVRTLSDARTRVHSLVVRLRARCLLLHGYVFDRDAVRMHDVIRDVALSIASEERGMHSIVIDKLEDCLNEKNLIDSKVISLLRNESSDTQLPEMLDCPHLESLFLVSDVFGETERRVPIPKHFFEKSKHHLKSLLFCKAELAPIPPSLHSLQNLQTLCLRNCVVEDVKLIGDLKSLIILDLSYSNITQLPIEVGQLNRLQLLNLEGCNALKVIEPNVISSLERLEELHVPYKFDKWEVGEITVSRRSNANLAELMNLPQLTSLWLRIPHYKTFPKYFKFSEELEQYRIFIGGSMPFDRDSELFGIARSLQLTLKERGLLKELGLESLVKRSETLSLDGLIGVKDVVCELDNEGFSDLKRLDFIHNDSVQYIVNCSVDQQIHLRKVFPMLERLRLGKLANLERICQGKLPQDSFNKLRKVYVTNCGKLKNLFPLSIAKRLQFIQVRNCDMMEEVVGQGIENDAHIISDEATHHVVEFLELRFLSLQSLPKFAQFISWSECGSSSVQSPIPLFCEKLEFPSLEVLVLSGIDVQILWLDFQPRTTSYMDNLTSLNVGTCNNLKYLFPFFIADRLVKLERLRVRDCKVMEDIVAMKNSDEEGRLGKILFPKLRYLKLYNLPALRNFCVGDCIKFESLSTLIIQHCPQMKTFATGDCVQFESLSALTIRHCPKMKTFVTGNCLEFKSLSMLNIQNCPELKTFFACSTPILEVSVDNVEGNHSAITQPFFNETVILPVLRYLEIDWSKAANEQLMLSQSSSTVSVLPLCNQLKELELNCITRDKPIAVPIFDLLRRYQNLEKLALKGFFVTPAQEYDGQLLANLTMLKLDNVPKLRSVFGESPNAQPTNLFACFQNLTILEVSFCHRLTYLLTPSTMASLVQLKQMAITNCNRMMEVIGDYREGEITAGEHDDHEIVFTRLEILELHHLPNLGSFYSGNNVMRFPELQELVVSRCPKMSTFSCGIVSTSMFVTVRTLSCRFEVQDNESRFQYTLIDNDEEVGYHNDLLVEDEWGSQSTYSDGDDSDFEEHRTFVEPKQKRWDGDVNTTVRKLWEDDSNLALQHLFSETVIMPDLEYLRTSQSKAINEILNTSPPSSSVPRGSLKELDMECITQDKPIGLSIFELLWRYHNLSRLVLYGFFVDITSGAQQLGITQEYDGELIASLTELSLYDIPKLRHLLGEPEVIAETAGDALHIRPSNISSVSFRNLRILEVSECHRLTYLLASTIATSLVQLEEMIITDCNMMTTIIKDYREIETKKNEHDHEFVLPKLRILELESLPYLESFYSGNTDIRLPKLEELVVIRCPEMRTFSGGNISTPMLDTVIGELIEVEWGSQSTCSNSGDVNEDNKMSPESARRERWDGDVNTTMRKLWEDDSNLTLQQLFIETEVHDSREGTSFRAARL